jgi:DNA ligase-1
MEDYKIVKNYPILYGLEKNKKTKVWEASVFLHDSSNKSLSMIKFGQLDGKMQTILREYEKGKNIGKKNETTHIEQCINETEKKWKDKKDKEGYKEEKGDEKGEEKSYPYYPMLAQTYDPNTKKNKKNNITFPCYVQPKLDGLRCIIYVKDDEIVCQSRTGTHFETLEHISKEIKELLFQNKDIIFDGELYTSEIPFEELAGLIKKKKITEDDIKKLNFVKYHIYDIIDEKETFENRHFKINSIFSKYTFNYIEKVETLLCDSLESFKSTFSNFVSEGYEGIMLRNIKGLYVTNYRSHDLQKYKEFIESEYDIVGYKEGEGRDKGTIIWICKAYKDKKESTFCVRPKGNIEMRKELYKNGESYIGKKLTVIYQELSEMGIPRFPVGKCIREDF